VSKTDFQARIAAGLETAGPRISGRVVSETDDSIVIKAEDAIIEIGKHHVSNRAERSKGDVELTLTPDATMLVSTVVSVEKGFVGSNIFGPLVPSVLADNCNCNCNCSSIQSTASVEEFSRLRRPFSGSA
jgi:hypothetical protein